MDKLLQEHNCVPSPAGMDRVQKFGQGAEKVVEWIKKQHKRQRRLKIGVGEGVEFTVLGVCLSCWEKGRTSFQAPAGRSLGCGVGGFAMGE